ncbi:MAG: ribonuclease III, partial [Gammaproteobacteria bacterium]|nr:ribonuclease III [Gammaproteobacteria bacterium]
MQSDWPQRWLSETLGLAPREASLYAAALTHRSAGGRNNERLEFLGDAVLNLLAAEMLYAHFPRASEGDLSRFRARLVSAEPLAAIAVRLGVGEQLQLGSGELKSGGFRRESILADAIEALIGATYLDAGLDGARVLVTRLFDGALEQLP